MKVILVGDINLLGLKDEEIIFRSVAPFFRKNDLVIGNLECCLYQPVQNRSITLEEDIGLEGFYVPPSIGKSLVAGGFHIVGNSNNKNFGADAILTSNQHLDRLGILHAGSGANQMEARAPATILKNGKKIAFIQRNSIYWPVNNHEAGVNYAGIAAMKAHTAYKPPYYFEDNNVAANRPGAPAKVVTWVDPEYFAQFQQDLTNLKRTSDVLISSHHWGYGDEILQYQKQLAYTAIDCGSDIIMGHGTHGPLAVEIYKGKPIFYGLGMFSFYKSKHRRHKGWHGLIGQVIFDDAKINEVSISIVRQDETSEILIVPPSQSLEFVQHIANLCEIEGTKLIQRDLDLLVVQKH